MMSEFFELTREQKKRAADMTDMVITEKVPRRSVLLKNEEMLECGTCGLSLRAADPEVRLRGARASLA
jgi:hypothetical protein